MSDIIVNRVANSGLLSIDLEEFLDKSERMIFDLKPLLFQGMILKEKDFRSFVKEHDWKQYSNKNVGIVCSVDAVIPSWAYMLLMSKFQPYVKNVIVGNIKMLERAVIDGIISSIDFSTFEGAKVVIKGCSDLSEPVYMLTEFTKMLLPYASSIMYGEPCSTVPIYKKKKK